MLRSVQGWLERTILGGRLQEWLWRNRHLYNRDWARGYLRTVDHPHRQQVADTVLTFLPVGSVLEIGCASGANLACLRERIPEARLIGVDISAHAIRTARSYFSARGDERTSFLVGRADHLPDTPDASVDVVLSDAVMMFVTPDRIQATLSELCRVARKGLVFNEYHERGAVVGRFEGGRWIYDLTALLQQLLPNARIEESKSDFKGGVWDECGTLIKVVR